MMGIPGRLLRLLKMSEVRALPGSDIIAAKCTMMPEKLGRQRETLHFAK